MRGIFATLFLAGLALARDRHFTLNVANGQVNLDGFSRVAVTVNGATPGQPLSAMKGDTLYVTVNNQLTDPNIRRSTTIHWHGLNQHENAFNDGPAFVTQCPIAPNHSYTYRLRLGNQAGTYWYHSHLSSQYVDGLRGPLIIYDPQDPHIDLYDVDDASTLIQLTDWYHGFAEHLAALWKSGVSPEPVPDSNLLNGKGRYTLGPEVERAVVTVTRGLRHRLRVINMSAVVSFKFAIESHSLTVIEADGVNHQPIIASSVTVAAGQRYSVVVNANQPVANYWISYESNFLGLTRSPANLNYNGSEAFAVLRYQGAPIAEPTTPKIIVPDVRANGGIGMLQGDQLKPLVNPAPPGGAKADLVVKLNFTTTTPGFSALPGVGNRWVVNGIEYTPPKIPTLLQILSGQKTKHADSVFTLPRNKNIEVQFIGDGDHPFHLHGHTFSVIRSATGPTNLVDPPRRDTVVTSNDQVNPVTIRFRTDNPGPWFLHCHKDWHLEAGLAVVFAEAPDDIRQGPQALNPTNEWNQLCPVYNALPADMQ